MRSFAKTDRKRVPGALGQGALLFAACLLCFGVVSAPCQQGPAPKAAVLVTQKIRPFLEALEGINMELVERGKGSLEVLFLEDFEGKRKVLLDQRLRGGQFDLVIAVGPGAARLIWSENAAAETVRLYTMVLNPERVIGPGQADCGVSLNIPAQTQLQMIRRGLPEVSRLGLVYDPQHNGQFAEDATSSASNLGLELVPLTVSSKKEMPAILERHWPYMDALWLIPDATVISETVVQYMIKEALLRTIPTVGYNRFFYESGAALAFVFDYRELGRQCVREALRILAGGKCRATSPAFEMWLNARVLRNLGETFPESPTLPLKVGP